MDRTTIAPAKLFSVEGMMVVITGGHTGIGLMMTKAFANNGAAKVYILGRRKEILEQAAKDASPHGNVVPIVCDVTSKESLIAATEQVKKDVGFVNLLICNSGAYPPPPKVKPTIDTPLEEYADELLKQNPEDWNGITNPFITAGFSVNTTAVAFTAITFLKLLSAGNKNPTSSPGRTSQILVTSSIAGYLRNPLGFNAYPITKAAVTHLVKCLCGALQHYDIRVNALAPGLFPSDLASALIPPGRDGREPFDDGAYGSGFIPAGRTGGQSDMAGTVLYLASPAAAYLNGNITVIDGGRIAALPSTY